MKPRFIPVIPNTHELPVLAPALVVVNPRSEYPILTPVSQLKLCQVVDFYTDRAQQAETLQRLAA
jgi:hypothetical protein